MKLNACTADAICKVVTTTIAEDRVMPSGERVELLGEDPSARVDLEAMKSELASERAAVASDRAELESARTELGEAKQAKRARPSERETERETHVDGQESGTKETEQEQGGTTTNK